LRLVWPEPLLLALLARPGRQEPADDLCECRPLLPAKSHCRPDLDRAEPRSDAGEYHPHAAVYAGPCLLARQYGDGRRAAVLGAEAVTLVARPPLLPILPPCPPPSGCCLGLDHAVDAPLHGQQVEE